MTSFVAFSCLCVPDAELWGLILEKAYAKGLHIFLFKNHYSYNALCLLLDAKVISVHSLQSKSIYVATMPSKFSALHKI
jgi:hypothetical protein